MTAMIRTVYLTHAGGKQAVNLPKRARPLHVYRSGESIAIDVVQDEDADTRAFDVSHQRYFEVVTRNGVVPLGARIGSVELTVGSRSAAVAFHVFEVQGR